MGRRPNPLILEFFERGAKLNDNSNRYHHQCKACGEDFPKGRIDSLITHLTKKCPAISEADRINACLALHGISHSSGRPKYDGLLHSGPNMGPDMATNGGHDTHHDANHDDDHNTSVSVDHKANQAQAQAQIWTPLETLAEVSRQIEANEKQDDHTPADTHHDAASEAVQTTLAAAITNLPSSSSNSFEVQEQFTLENPPLSYSNQPGHEKKDTTPQKPSSSEFVHNELSTEEQRLHQLLQSSPPSQTALSVAAAAATARLSSSLLDPQLISDAGIAEQIAEAAPSDDMMIDYPEPEKEEPNSQPAQPGHVTPPPFVRAPESSTPWDDMTHMAEGIHGPAMVTDHGQQLGPNLKGGYRMDTTTSPDGSRHKHCRAKFNKHRRIEVQEVRRIGACIRCRILRKVCSKGTPCVTCMKVLSPRVWRTGCVRTKLSAFIDLYSAGVQVVMTQQRINEYKTSYNLFNVGVIVLASHFPGSGHTVDFQVLQGYPKAGDQNEIKVDTDAPVILLDNNKEDIPSKVETYMRNMLPQYIMHEPSPHVRATLEVADRIAKETNDELLKRSLELWGIVEMMDRERQWTMVVTFLQVEMEDHCIKDDTESEAYSNICMQLTAAAERKASVASRNLLNGIQRSLQDGKTKIGFPMFLTVMLFLNCLEKTTWAFKAWDQENLRPKWPLQKPPDSYTSQGHSLTELLRMLLLIRHVLPKTNQSNSDAPITAEGEGPEVKKYFQDLNVTPRYLRTRYHENNFQPTDSRSLEFLFCSQLLLPAPPAHAVLHPITQPTLQEPTQSPSHDHFHGPPHESPQGHAQAHAQDHHHDHLHDHPQEPLPNPAHDQQEVSQHLPVNFPVSLPHEAPQEAPQEVPQVTQDTPGTNSQELSPGA